MRGPWICEIPGHMLGYILGLHGPPPATYYATVVDSGVLTEGRQAQG
jgi:hypothetical protein